MATNKTLNPTGVTIAIPAMADKPDASVFSNCIDKEADAINTLNSNLAKITTSGYVTVETEISTTGTNITYTTTKTGLYAIRASTGSTAGKLNAYMFDNSNRLITTMIGVDAPAWATIFTPPIPLMAGITIKAQFIGPAGASGAVVIYNN